MWWRRSTSIETGCAAAVSGSAGASGRAESEIEAITLEQVRERIGDVRGGDALPELAKRVVAGEIDPYQAASELVDTVSSG